MTLCAPSALKAPPLPRKPSSYVIPQPIDRLFKRIVKELDLPDPALSGPVAVAMSGGVDSSTIAAVLKKLGYQVVGLTMRLYQAKGLMPQGTCCAGRDIADAQKVAAQMGFPHYVLDYQQRFDDTVINPFIDSYLKGQTPIPCVLCNQKVKFEDLLGQAKDLGCQALVTGHYIRRLKKPPTPKGDAALKEIASGSASLFKGLDESRDQSYFLFTTTCSQLAFLRFPLGGLLKSETRELAHFFGLGVASKQESQDICFVGGKKYEDILIKHRDHPLKPGPITNLDGAILGTHKGIGAYTIGQRRGLGISSAAPLFVIDIVPEENRLVVGPFKALQIIRLKVDQINWLFPPHKLLPQSLDVRLRSMGAFLPAKVLRDLKTQKAFVTLLKPESGIAPGQACVFYHKNEVLGGGWITSTQRKKQYDQEALWQTVNTYINPPTQKDPPFSFKVEKRLPCLAPTHPHLMQTPMLGQTF